MLECGRFNPQWGLANIIEDRCGETFGRGTPENWEFQVSCFRFEVSRQHGNVKDET